jgi:uncharacterized protein YcnI
MNAVRRLTISIGVVSSVALVAAVAASAHAIMSPAVAKANNTLQQFTLSVPTEESGQTTNKIELTVPSTFSIDSFEPPPAPWKMQTQTSGSGSSAVVTKVTWTGGNTPTNLDSVFRFNASISKPGTVIFHVRQTYSSGKVVDWSGPESSDTPAPRVQALGSFSGGGGTSILSIIAVILGAAALLLAGLALFGGKRQLA